MHLLKINMFNILSLTLDSQILFRQIGNIASLALNHVTLDCVCYLWETVAAKMLYFLTVLRTYPFTEFYSTNCTRLSLYFTGIGNLTNLHCLKTKAH